MSKKYRAILRETEQRKAALRQEIMITVRANLLPVTGEFWLMLVFRTESELKQIAHELHIHIPQCS